MPWISQTKWLEPEADGFLTRYESGKVKNLPDWDVDKPGTVWDLDHRGAEISLCRNMQKYYQMIEEEKKE